MVPTGTSFALSSLREISTCARNINDRASQCLRQQSTTFLQRQKAGQMTQPTLRACAGRATERKLGATGSDDIYSHLLGRSGQKFRAQALPNRRLSFCRTPAGYKSFLGVP
ncbi:hypothetical protein ASE99_01625 [Serratia sp. Leaf51]|nr:hypothetical protein ASE99_01625 [Serratia sp. Leaf51]